MTVSPTLHSCCSSCAWYFVLTTTRFCGFVKEGAEAARYGAGVRGRENNASGTAALAPQVLQQGPCEPPPPHIVGHTDD